MDTAKPWSNPEYRLTLAFSSEERDVLHRRAAEYGVMIGKPVTVGAFCRIIALAGEPPTT